MVRFRTAASPQSASERLAEFGRTTRVGSVGNSYDNPSLTAAGLHGPHVTRSQDDGPLARPGHVSGLHKPEPILGPL